MDTSALLHSFMVALSVRTPFLLVFVIGTALSWYRVRPVSKFSHAVCVAGLFLLAAHAVADAFGRAYGLQLVVAHAAREEVLRANALWTLTTFVLLICAVSCLVVAVVAGRKSTVAVDQQPSP